MCDNVHVVNQCMYSYFWFDEHDCVYTKYLTSQRYNKIMFRKTTGVCDYGRMLVKDIAFWGITGACMLCLTEQALKGGAPAIKGPVVL